MSEVGSTSGQTRKTSKEVIAEKEKLIAQQQSAIQAQTTELHTVKAELEQLRQLVLAAQSLPQAASSAQQQPPTTTTLPAPVKLEKPNAFKGDMDGDSIVAFTHKCDLFFSLAGMVDVHQCAVYAVLLLQDQAYTWYTSIGYMLGSPSGLEWSRLKQDLHDHFRPVDYSYQARQLLAKCQQMGDARGYVQTFWHRLVHCDDITDSEALFCFINGITGEVQRFIRLAKPGSSHQAATVAEQIGSTLLTQSSSKQSTQSNQPYPQPKLGPQPMQLGTAQQGKFWGQRSPQRPQGQRSQSFQGQCWNCGRTGHQASECRQPEQGQKKQWKGVSKGRLNALVDSDSVVWQAVRRDELHARQSSLAREVTVSVLEASGSAGASQ